MTLGPGCRETSARASKAAIEGRPRLRRSFKFTPANARPADGASLARNRASASKRRHAAIAPRIGGPFEHAGRQANDRARMSHHRIECRNQLDIVAR